MARPKSLDPKSHLFQVKLNQDLLDAVHAEFERLRSMNPDLTITLQDAARSLLRAGFGALHGGK